MLIISLQMRNIFFFFQLFTSVVVFGLFHGLLFLPVILSLFGPDKKKQEDTKIDDGAWEPSKYCTLPLPPATNTSQ